MSFSLGMLRVRVSFFFAVGMCLFSAFCPWQQVAALLSAVLLHESMHILCLRRFGKCEMSLTVGLFGMRLQEDCLARFGYKEEMFTVLSAPLANAVCFLLLLPWLQRGPFFYYSAAVHLSLAVFNLLPLRMLDGGRALHCVLLSHMQAHDAEKCMHAVEAVAFVLLLVLLIFVGQTSVSELTFFTVLVYLSFLFLFRK